MQFNVSEQTNAMYVTLTSQHAKFISWDTFCQDKTEIFKVYKNFQDIVPERNQNDN